MFLSEFLKKIFSITLTEDYIRYRFYILGIKISFPRPICVIRKLNNPFYKYKKLNREISTLPKATGQLRDIQLSNLAILKEIDKVCRELNIGYWLDYGSLLGAIRHKGFIPWDDDIDISMLRSDFEYFIKMFEQISQNKDLQLKHHFNKGGSYLLKITHKKCKALFVDIFVYDYCEKHSDDSKKIQYTKELQVKRQNFLKTITFNNGSELYKKYESLRKDCFSNLDISNNDNLDLVYGIEFGHEPYIRNNWVMPINDILPIKEIEFEGMLFYSVNNPHNHLKEVFNNYMTYPRKIDFGHGAYIKLTKEEKEEIDKLKSSIGVV